MSKNRWQIAFAPEGDGLYEVTVRRTGSVYRFTTRLPPDISDLWAEVDQSESAPNRSFRRAADDLTPEARFFQAANLPTLKEIGSRLLASVINLDAGNEGTETVGALKERMNSNDGVDIEFDLSQAAELSAIPWESLYLGGEKDQFLAIFSRTNIVRRLDAQSELPPPIERPIRILVAAANPREDLDTHVELGNIQRRIDELVKSGSSDFAVESLPAVTRDQFRRKVMEWKPHVIHYIGHSAFHDDSGYLYFETDQKGISDKVSAETLRNLLLNRRPWLVILNSCQSGQTSRELPMAGVAQNLLQRLNIPFVVAMQQPVSDDAAINFSQDFYSALTDGETIASAVTMGRCAIANNADERTQVELITPALYTSGDTDRIHFVDDAMTGAAAKPTAVTAEAPTATGGFLASRNAKIATMAGLAGIVGIGAFFAWPERGTPGDADVSGSLAAASPETASPPFLTPGPIAQNTSGNQETASLNATAQAASTTNPAVLISGQRNGRSEAGANGSIPPNSFGQLGGERQPLPTRDEEGRRIVAARQIVDANSGKTFYLLELKSGDEVVSNWPQMPGEILGAGDNRTSSYRLRELPDWPEAPAQGYGSARYVPETAETLEYPAIIGQSFQTVSASVPPATGEAQGEWPSAYRSETLQAAGLPPRANADELNFFRPPGFCDGLLTTVHFDLASGQLDEENRRRLNQQAYSLDCPESRLVIAGFTDSSGPLDLNIDLSLERARAAAEALRTRREGRSKTTTLLAFAEELPIVQTNDGEVEPSNRRAEIYVDFDCNSLDEAEVTLASDENFDMSPPPTPYPQGVYAFKPLRIVYQARGFTSEDPEILGSAHMLADARLAELSREVSRAWNVPPGMISSIKIGGKCLAPGEDERVDIDF
ncbi:OmpA family protein [Altererythrobacter xiamenensis]|uniref:OmpA family protein n=1 Tax=Altererythrobacter xiamenensis TaxID=1316679 RepID=A0A1Y6FJJ6_9SPHN|nr:CHAT domain-containing protein [Altererythrobacter xiamenensis]SMQ73370.1 OmpA family protein [Altererythrobacter xiamenensis]